MNFTLNKSYFMVNFLCCLNFLHSYLARRSMCLLKRVQNILSIQDGEFVKYSHKNLFFIHLGGTKYHGKFI